jgi:hypothetical protein
MEQKWGKVEMWSMKATSVSKTKSRVWVGMQIVDQPTTKDVITTNQTMIGRTSKHNSLTPIGGSGFQKVDGMSEGDTSQRSATCVRKVTG